MTEHLVIITGGAARVRSARSGVTALAATSALPPCNQDAVDSRRAVITLGIRGVHMSVGIKAMAVALAVVGALAAVQPAAAADLSPQQVTPEVHRIMKAPSVNEAGVAQPLDWSDCPEGYMCLWESWSYTWYMVWWKEGTYNPDFTSIKCPHNYCNGTTFDNDATSWANRTHLRYCISTEPYGRGSDNSLPPFTGSNFTSGWDNVASSISYIGCP